MLSVHCLCRHPAHISVVLLDGCAIPASGILSMSARFTQPYDRNNDMWYILKLRPMPFAQDSKFVDPIFGIKDSLYRRSVILYYIKPCSYGCPFLNLENKRWNQNVIGSTYFFRVFCATHLSIVMRRRRLIRRDNSELCKEFIVLVGCILSLVPVWQNVFPPV